MRKYVANEYKNIPQELRQLKQWGLYKLENADKGHGASKKPINANTGAYASSTNADTWTDFDTALNNLGQYNTNGLAFFFANGYVGLDLDELTQLKQKVAQKNKTVQTVMDKAKKPYIERSQSGTGIHAIFKGSLQKDWKHKSNGHEIYDSGRFFALTGDALNAPDELPKLNDLEMPKLYDTFFDKPVSTRGDAVSGPSGNNKDLAEIFQIAKNDDKFNSLIKGDIRNYNSQSEADQALANKAIWYANHDMDKAREIMENSALVRDKWYEKHGRDTYLNLTLQRADKDTVGGLTPKENKYSIQFNHIDKAVNTPKNIYTGVVGDYLNSFDLKNEKAFNARMYRMRKMASIIGYPMAGDTGLAIMFLKVFPNKYLHADTKTYLFNGIYWEEDQTDQMRKDLEDVIRALGYLQPEKDGEFESQGEKGTDTTDLTYKKYKRKYLDNGPKTRVINEICSRVSVRSDIFDRDNLLLNTPECTISFHDNRVTTKQHDPKDFITGVTAAHYDKNAPYPANWMKLLEDIFGRNIEEAKKRLGYAITGTAREQIMMIIRSVGEGKENGSNGKSTLVNGAKRALGSFYAPQIDVNVYLKKSGNNAGNATPELVRLKNARLAVSAEPNGDVDLDETRLKQFTGEDSINIRGLYSEDEEFIPAFVPIMTTNYNVGVAGATNNGLWRRLEYMSTDLVVAEDKKDKELPAKIAAEADGILWQLVLFAKKYFRDGISTVGDWQDSKNKATAQFNPLEEFIQESLHEFSGNFIPTGDIYRAWLRWADSEQKKTYRTEKSFSMALSKSSVSSHRAKLNNVRGYSDLQFGPSDSNVKSLRRQP